MALSSRSAAGVAPAPRRRVAADPTSRGNGRATRRYDRGTREMSNPKEPMRLASSCGALTSSPLPRAWQCRPVLTARMLLTLLRSTEADFSCDISPGRLQSFVVRWGAVGRSEGATVDGWLHCARGHSGPTTRGGGQPTHLTRTRCTRHPCVSRCVKTRGARSQFNAASARVWPGVTCESKRVHGSMAAYAPAPIAADRAKRCMQSQR